MPEGGDVTISHNDFAGPTSFVVPEGSVFDNISAPPLFCSEPLADFHLQECSPCVGAAHDGSDIGAFEVGCQCYTAIHAKSWGAIKSRYR